MKLVLILSILGLMSQNNTAIIFDFSNTKDLTNWNIVNDGVMGGLSQGALRLNKSGNGLFEGYVTTQNNGGFSSVRYDFNRMEVSAYTHVVLKLKGDGKAYQFRIKENQQQRHSYIASFETTGDWETIKIPLASFYPGFRGNKLEIPNFEGAFMEEIAILIGNKKKENFSLEIQSIYLE